MGVNLVVVDTKIDDAYLSDAFKIFDYKLFKSHAKFASSQVKQLQSLLSDILEERLNLFSRKFPIKITHDLTGCYFHESSCEINPESIPFKTHSLDLILSSGPLMIVNDVPGVLRQWYMSLKPGGVFMAAFFGEESLVELRECFFRAEEKLQIPHAVRFFPTISTKDAGMLLQRAGFYLPTSDKTRLVLHADTLDEILKCLKAMGGNILYNRSKQILPKAFLKMVEEEYSKNHSDKSGLKVTIDIVCMTGWAIERYADERIHQQKSKKLGYQ